MNNKVLITAIVSIIVAIALMILIVFMVIINGTSIEIGSFFDNIDVPDIDIVISKNSSLAYPAVVTVERYSSDYCQVRLDFEDFNIGEANDNGTCNSGIIIAYHDNTNGVPVIICGENRGQHILYFSLILSVYLNFYEGYPILITIYTPNDCLQYFPEPNGIVSSFNFQDVEKVSKPPKQYQLSNMTYLVCIGSSNNTFNNITWTKGENTTDYYFVLTGRIETISKEVVGTLEAAEFGPACSTTSQSLDYIEIKNGEFTNANGTVERNNLYCGAGFPNSVICSLLEEKKEFLFLYSRSLSLSTSST
ncbi:hypothetical protein Anas_10704 [Armadillidium nasatum]|uniref:CUB domain-containing protein n=1 Tax=Armadillidium nasatum TaxID=96803 RepID=A0A5N5T756_9CRUS|nr:hypothetical protein Anas_10704 [Armadillidium nasatum]